MDRSAAVSNVRKGTLIMTVGLPGVGLGGVFYLVSALLMPIREAMRFGRARGRTPRRLSLVVWQFALAGGILGALWATGWVLGRLIAASPRATAAASMALRHGVAGNVLRTSALLLSLGTLAVVLMLVQVARLVVRMQDAREREPREISAPTHVDDAQGLRLDSGTFARSR
jgi:hypothetical protein